MRVCATQASPLFIMALAMSSGSVWPRSASSSTTAADFPPSSSVTRLRCSPQMAPTLRPAAVDPVKLTLSTPGWRTRYSPTSRPAGRIDTMPLGSSISSRTSASR
jgi:hypothetical protein